MLYLGITICPSDIDVTFNPRNNLREKQMAESEGKIERWKEGMTRRKMCCFVRKQRKTIS